MDKGKLIDLMGLIEGGGFSITDVEMVQWGRSLVFECVYRTVSTTTAPDDPVIFQMVFHECREMKYKVYAHISLQERGTISQVADIAELALGQGGHRRDAHILTTHFGATISYGSISFHKDSQTYRWDA